MLEVNGIDLFYGSAQALSGASLSADIGKVTCLMGRNGVGKTTLLRAIVGHVPVSSGSVRWEGADITALAPPARARKKIAYIPQGREIFPLLTVRENLQTGFAQLPRPERSIPGEIFDLFPVLADMMNRRGGDLSGGQQQQLAIARALVTRPRLLIMDEPTEGIQPSIIKSIGEVINHLRLQRQMAILLVEQYFEFARDLADTFAVLDRGSVVLAGAIDAVPEQEIRKHLLV